jgi:hypothetical protein
MKSLHFLLFIVIFGFSSIKSLAQQTDLADSVASNATKREKIYIHFDKNTYLPGDTVWFKAYLFADSRRSVLSKNFYFELLSSKGDILDRFTAPIFESSSSGFVTLPFNSSSTIFYCRAYTVAILNADTSLVFKKALPLATSVVTENKKKEVIAHARFLPEGGNWVNNLPSVVAFKITDEEGFPLAAKGSIKDNNNRIVAEFQTTHNGMGLCTMMPQSSNSYSASWQLANGKQYTTQLPIALEQGINLQVSATSKGRRVLLFRSNKINEENKKLTIVAIINSTVIYQSSVDFGQEMAAKIVIPTEGLPTGILYITVLNSKKVPVAERITFLNNLNYKLDINTTFSQVSIEKRALNHILLNKKDSVRANLSVSVTDADVDPPGGNQDNIVTHLLLTGDLRGRILNPGYYFINNDDSTQRNLDLVMLTNGWRKYEWSKPSAFKENLKESDFLNINGRLKGLNAKNLTAETKMNAIVSTSDSSTTLIDFPIAGDGTFSKNGVIYYGNATLVLKFNKKDLITKAHQIELQNGLLKSYEFKNFDTASYSKDFLQKQGAIAETGSDNHFQQNKLKGRTLSEVIIKGKSDSRLEVLDKKYATGFFKGGISRNVDLGSDPRSLNYLSLFQYLQMNVTGLQILGAASLNPSVTWRKEPVKFYLNNNESSIVDIRTIPMAELDYIKIYDPTQGGIFRSVGGTIAVYTKQGKGLSDAPNNSLKVNLEGYSLNKEFYSPEYVQGISSNSAPDLRTTLLWNPNVIMDEKTHKLDLIFYNNDVTKHIKVVIEGMNLNGQLFHQEKLL